MVLDSGAVLGKREVEAKENWLWVRDMRIFRGSAKLVSSWMGFAAIIASLFLPM